MDGRITSEDVAARNAHGVPYRQLLQSERARNKRIEQKLRDALAAWWQADQAESNSNERRHLLETARSLTLAAVS